MPVGWLALGVAVALGAAGVAWWRIRRRRLERLRRRRLLEEDFLDQAALRLQQPVQEIRRLLAELTAGSAVDAPWIRDRLDTLDALARHVEREALRRFAPEDAQRTDEGESPPSDPRREIAAACEILAPLAAARQLGLTRSFTGRLPAIAASPAALRHLLATAVGAAIRAVDGGWVEIEARAEDGGVGLTLRAGSPPRDANWLPSSVADATATLGGRLRPGDGADPQLLHLWLPAAGPAGSPAAEPPAVPQDSGGLEAFEPLPSPSRRRRVLLVDDEAVFCRLIEGMLGPEGYDVESVACGEEALERLGAEPEYDLVLLDVKLPGISGFETCRRLRRRVPAHCLPVIFVTGLPGSVPLTEGLQSGGDDFLAKPIRREELLARLDLHLELMEISRQGAA